MSDGRKRLSGYQFRKNAKEKREKEEKVLKQTATLELFFSKSNSTSVACASTRNNNSETEAVKRDSILNQSTTAVCKEENDIIIKDVEKETTTINEIVSTCDKDPAKWILNESTRDYFAVNRFIQNKDADFKLSKREYSDQARYFSSSLFQRKLLNGEKCSRTWLIYSESTNRVFCGPCRLLNVDNYFAKEGFNDWKNMIKSIECHENSNFHKSSILTLKIRGNKIGQVDKTLIKQLDEEISYWRKVLERVVAVVRSLSSRALPLRGHEEKFGSPKNGNFLMALELISQFDPFLAEHIKRYGNPGSGHTNYLSATIYEELIQLMAKQTQETILAEIKKAKYYSVIIDSTPDISHIDQLSFIIRYVQECGSPVERFITFLPNTGHKSQELAETVSKTLIDLDIDISSCRGQSYDNAANMSGAYSGLQMRIKELNPLAEYVPCAAHSLNLVGTCAASCCTEATNFFGVLQELFNFFSASTHRWEILQSYMKAKLTLKRLSTTRWSARDDACRSLNESWLEIIEALSFIENNAAEKNITRSEAKGLRIRLERLETAFMAIFWGTLLSRLNASSKKLQSIDIDISIVLELYKSLINFVQRIRNDFDEFENKAKLLSNEQKYERCKSRIKKRKLQLDESRDGDADETFCSRDRFRIETFLVILDSLRTELEKRCSGYELIHDRFIVLIKLRELSSVEIREHAIRVCEGFPDDIELSIVEELLHLREQLLLPENISVSVQDICT
ncbi:zinc finger MYM-type protein 1-like [Solenopsis invicta]|uniref:zinc finger MYM-type protein 1-like n=1 Tax=Solenopsis invicta TaxID=13686 RepID=UPI00193E4166|nr:zinc finger MYM-type protein 1-like [Solenopsis invicta]